MTNMVIVLFAYSVSAYVFSGLTCYLAFLRQFNQNRKPSQFNIMLLANLWIMGLWPIWIMRESFGGDRNDDTIQEHPATNCLLSDRATDESCHPEKPNWN